MLKYKIYVEEVVHSEDHEFELYTHLVTATNEQFDTPEAAFAWIENQKNYSSKIFVLLPVYINK